MAAQYIGDRKILKAEDTQDQLRDALADTMLLMGTADIGPQIEQAKHIAERDFHIEKDGESDGYKIYVNSQDGSGAIVTLAEWLTREQA